MLILCKVHTIRQSGGRADMDIRDTQGGSGTGEIQGAQIVDLKGQLRVGINIGNAVLITKSGRTRLR